MKKIINEPTAVVRQALEGYVALNSTLVLAQDFDVVLLDQLPGPDQRKVAVISGGGAGHEPAHVGYVGKGMLTAAISGAIFTSPDVDSILAAIRATAGPAGALLVVKNYTGDRLNFGLAAELAKTEGIPCEIVLVADDVSLLNRLPKEKARGLAGTVLVHKIAGAMAARGDDLASVHRVALAVAAGLSTMGVALSPCTLPGTGSASFALGDMEVEFGLGIHGEKGLERAPILPADGLVGRLLASVTAHVSHEGPVVVLVNGLGGTPPIELSLVAGRVLQKLKQLGVSVGRAYCGNFMTSLEMQGISITVLTAEPEWFDLLDAETEATAWPKTAMVADPDRQRPLQTQANDTVPSGSTVDPDLKKLVSAISHALINHHQRLGELDARTGDGDLGMSMQRAAQALLQLPDNAYKDARSLTIAAANALRRAVGGSSGPFYAVGLLRAAERLGRAPSKADALSALEAACQAISQLGGARRGDRTMLDALYCGNDALKSCDSASVSEQCAAWVEGVERGVEATKYMIPRAGRAAYLGDEVRGHEDAGAAAVAVWVQAMALELSRQRT